MNEKTGNIEGKTLTDVLKELRDEYKSEWDKVEGEINDILSEIRGILLDKIESGSEFSREDAERIMNLKNKNRVLRFILQFMIGRGKAAGKAEEAIPKVLNNRTFRETVVNIINDRLDQDEIIDYIDKLKNIKNLGLVSLSSWLAIIKPDYFMPVWEAGILSPGLYENTEISEFYGWYPNNTTKFAGLLNLLRESANRAGIDNMFEAAFYLSKYRDTEGDAENSNATADNAIAQKIESLLESKKQIILYGPPGTGKTWHARNYVIQNNNIYKFITFHPSYSYEEFVEGLKPENNEDGQITYRVEEGIFKKICRDAFNALMDSAGIETRWESREDLPELNEKDREKIKDKVSAGSFPKFFLIIDEINRGDISKIFGELITLLEADKRLFADNELTVILPYSKKKFGIPPNLYIIGTMNTADRSIALIDVALRRRFGFVEVPPSYSVLLRELGLNKDSITEEKAIEILEGWKENELREDIKKLAIRVLYTLNQKIQLIYDRDHQIGHSYFLKLKDGNIETLRQVWYCEVVPLLQEYFYNDWEKLKYLLKGGFVEELDLIYLKDDNLVYEDEAITHRIRELSNDDFTKAMINVAEIKS